MADTAPTTQLGTASSSLTGWGGYPHDPSEYAPDLQGQAWITVADKMRTDSMLDEIYQGVSLPIIGGRWFLNPRDARAEVVELFARCLNTPILDSDTPPARLRTRGKVKWSTHLREAMLQLIYGHAVFEQVWELDERTGLFEVAQLASRPVHSIESIDTDARGRLAGVKQYVPAMGGQPPRIQPIPATPNLLFYSHNREGGAWQGRSMYRPAYRPWLLKDKYLRIDAQAAERHGVGVPIVTMPEGSTPEQVAEGSKMAQAYRGGSAAGGALPYGASLDVVGVKGTTHDTLASIRYQDEQIARAALRTFTMLGQTSNGSRALGETLADDFLLSLQAFAWEIADTIQEQVIEVLGDWNWGPNEPLPTLEFAPIGSDPELTVDALAKLVQAGVITPDDAVEAFIRNRYDLPELDDRIDGAPVAAALSPSELAELVQKIYLGVGKVLTADEARDILNRAGAGLTGSLPEPVKPEDPAQVTAGKAPARVVRAAYADTITAEQQERSDLLAELEADLNEDTRVALEHMFDAPELAQDFAESGIADSEETDRTVLLALVATWFAAWLLLRPANTAPLTDAVERANTVGYGVGRGAVGTADEIIEAVAELPARPGLDDLIDGTPDVVDGVTATRVDRVTLVLTDAADGTIEPDALPDAINTAVTDGADTVAVTELYTGHTEAVLDELEEAVVEDPERLYRYLCMEDKGVCASCFRNAGLSPPAPGTPREDATDPPGLYKVGVAPRHGYPPVHPKCRCIIIAEASATPDE